MPGISYNETDRATVVSLSDLLSLSRNDGFGNYKSESVDLTLFMQFVRSHIYDDGLSRVTGQYCVKYLCDITCDDQNNVVKIFNYLKIKVENGFIIDMQVSATPFDPCEEWTNPCECQSV